MKYNENISIEYGEFGDIMGESPIPSRPSPNIDDYKLGIFKRAFAKKINDERIVEISMEQANNLNTDLYIVIVAQWTISGIRETKTTNGILEHGVNQMNRFEIDRIKKEQFIDLNKVLPNMLEYWRGH